MEGGVERKFEMDSRRGRRRRRRGIQIDETNVLKCYTVEHRIVQRESAEWTLREFFRKWSSKEFLGVANSVIVLIVCCSLVQQI